MPIQPTEGRNIVNFARKIIAEKLIFERRAWDNMIGNKLHEDVRVLGQQMLANYRTLMIGVTSMDLLFVDAASVNSDVVNMTEGMLSIVNSLTRYLLVEFTMEEINELLLSIAKSIIQWNLSNNGKIVKNFNNNDIIELTNINDELKEAIDLLAGVLSNDLNYVTLILLSDLHHMTYVASADQCYEILSST